MSRTYKYLLSLAALTLCFSSTSAAETQPINMLVLLPGMTKIIELNQQATLPQGCPQFFILTIGSGFLGISVKKDDLDGDTIFMAGFVSAGGRLIPIKRIGSSVGMIDQIVELKGGATALGFAWIWCGVAASQNVPLYHSQLRLSLQP